MKFNTSSRRTEVLIFQRLFVRCFTWAARSTQEAHWAPPGRGFHHWVIPRSCLGKQRVTCMWVRPDSRARRVVVAGHAQATSYFDQVMSR